MDFETMFWQFLVMAIIMLYFLLAVAVFLGIPLCSVIAFVVCLVLFFISEKKSKRKKLWGILSILSGIVSAGIISLLVFFIVHLATTPITFM